MIARRENDRNEIRDAVTKASATENIGRLYCEELIAASRDLVGIWYRSQRPELNRPLGEAIRRLQKLVGRP